MTRPTRRPESSFLTFRKRTPKDILAKAKGQAVTIAFPEDGEGLHTATFTIGPEVKFSLKARNPVNARARTGFAEAFLARHWESIRKGPISLTHKQTIALSGEVYRLFAEGMEDNPGSAALWDAFLESIAEVLAGPVGAGKHVLIIGDQMLRRDLLLEERFGRFADMVLTKHHLVIDQTSRKALLFQVALAVNDAAQKLHRNVAGDYRPDANAERFGGPFVPAAKKDKAIAEAKDVSLKGLVEAWWKEAQKLGRKPSTYESYSNSMAAFVAFLKHDDASRVTPEDVISFKDFRLQQVNPRTGKPISPKTVKDSDLAGLRSVFDWAVKNRKMDTNPATGVTLKLGKVQRKRALKGFTDAEAEAILKHAVLHERGKERPKTFAAKRWVPWLCAYTGARVGEIAQLRKEDIREEGGHWVITITPEAGTVKTDEAREVPLHPHVVEMGFPSFVRKAEKGHLFLTPAKNGNVLGPLQGVKNRLAEFAREVVGDPNVQPNHGWRHRFKTIAREVGMDAGVRDAIQGHDAKSVAEDYGDVTLKARVDAIAKLPRYKV